MATTLQLLTLFLVALGVTACRKPSAPESNFQALLVPATSAPDTPIDWPRLLAELTTRAQTLDLAAAFEEPGENALTIRFHAADQDQARARLEALVQSGHLSIRAVHDRTPFFLADRSQIPPGYSILTHSFPQEDGTERTDELVVADHPILTSAQIKRAAPDLSPGGEEGMIRLFLTLEGGKAMMEATKTMKKGRSRLAIIYDDRIISAPRVGDTLSSQFVIQGFPTLEETKAIAAALTQPLSAKLRIESLIPLAPAATKP